MFRTNSVVRTVWVKDLTTEKRQGNNGEYDAKSILFRVASDRNYTRTVIKDGKQEVERPTDFVLCRANGALAEIIANNCKAVDAEGKLISRHLYLDGHFEMYQSKRNFEIRNLPVLINGITYTINFDTEQNVDGLIFVVDEMEFLDKKPTPTVQTNGATVSNVTMTPQVQAQVPVQVPANGAPVYTNIPPQNFQQPQTQYVAPQVPVAGTNVQATVGTPVQQNTGFAGAMNPPVVPEGFNGQTTPF